MEIQLVNSTKKIKLPEEIFDCEFKEPLIHQAVTSYLSTGRAGTHAQKTRAEVRGGGIKPWKQKGTGRARAGTIRSPLWRKGGVIFAAKPRSYKLKMNKKAYRAAMRSILSELIRQSRMLPVDNFALESPKTKLFISALENLFKDTKKEDKSICDQRVLIISDKLDANLALATRNLHNVAVRESLNIDPVVLVNADKIIITKEALKRIEEWLK